MITRRQALQAAIAVVPLASSAQAANAVLPKLPYATDALEPFIDARTMEIHHGKHHQAYVDNLNRALATQPEIANQPLETLIGKLATVPEQIRTAVRNNGGGHLNHSLFWQTLGKPKAGPSGRLRAAIDKSFGNQTAFQDKLRTTGLGVFGSGWVWVIPTGKDALKIEPTPNQDNPWMAGRTPLFGIDVWEHAYYLKYQNRRADYLTAILQVINWDFVNHRFEEIAR